jgi:tetratricopeptide (TPR) repeat protein
MRSAFVGLFGIFLMACAKPATTVQQNTNAVAAPQRAEKLESVTAHTTENQPMPLPSANEQSGPKSHWTQSGNPIDTSKFDTSIAAAEKAFKAKPKDSAAKQALSDAYLNRAMALTDARQYASALGDFRRALKYDPSSEDAKTWIDEIINIYDSMNKEYPKEGEEPPPLPSTGKSND